MRKTNCLEDIIQGCVSGYRSRGRQRRRWTENITDWTGLQVNTAVSVTEDRHRWNHDMLTANPLGGRRLTTTVLTRGLLAVANVVLPTLSCPLNTTIVSKECTYRQCFFKSCSFWTPPPLQNSNDHPSSALNTWDVENLRFSTTSPFMAVLWKYCSKTVS